MASPHEQEGRCPAMDALLNETTQTYMNVALLAETTSSQWNDLIQVCREQYGDEWGPDFSGSTIESINCVDRDFGNANLRGTRCDYSDFTRADLSGAKVNSLTSFYRSTLTGADVTGVCEIDGCQGIDRARGLYDAIGYTPPLPVVTEAAARAVLREAIDSSLPDVCEGLSEMSAEGMRLQWRDDNLHFWFAHEINRQIDPCKTGDCDCEVDHACAGDCSCCSCYNNDCECEADHAYEISETNEWYLATVAGHIEYRWTEHRGLTGHIVMSCRSMHPHVSTSGTICWGDTDIPQTLKAADYLMTIMGWIGQHNPSDPYRDIFDLPLVRTGY